MSLSKERAVESEGASLESSILFWREQLDNSELLALPADFPLASSKPCLPKHLSFSLPSSFRDSLRLLGNQAGATLFSTLLAAYNALLFRYTRQEDIVIGYLTANHYTKVFRTDLSANPTFTELLDRVHQVVLTGSPYKAVPYEALEEAMQAEHGADFAGLYNVAFSFRNAGIESLKINDPVAGNAVELALHIEETIHGLEGTWTYNAALFEAATIGRLAKHFEVLLQSIVSGPARPISELQLLTVSERRQLTSVWNTSAVAYPADKCIHELFEEQVRKTPGAIALVFEREELTYAALNERANQLAHYLCSIGVTPETLVPLCTGRSMEMIIGMLGILKAGGAYVPIDPNYPLERIAYMLKDTNASFVICNKDSIMQLREACLLKNAAASATFQKINLVELNNEGASLKSQPMANLNIDLSPNSLAYIIYTSGSTGQPKGVMIEHRSLADHCYGVIESAGLKACSSFALFSPLVFDAGHSIIHSSFILGASLHVLAEELIMSSEKVAAYLKDHTIDCIKIVPSLWLTYANLQKIILAKKVMIFGGEAFHPAILGQLTKSAYRGNVYNHYGPTEVTIGKCIYQVDLHKAYRTVPIGKPFSNTRLYVLDERLQLTPTGIEGELYVAGDGVARGYLNRPDLTAEKFIPNPFEPSGRMYRTGDKVSWLPDGNIGYLGRADEQVKIQGHRIELGEIEDTLLQCELVRQAVVLANADKKGNKRLVAYIVPAKTFNKEAITDFLRKKLPEYMVPVSCTELENLPLTKNGKINKKELEKLGETGRKYIAPQDDTEAELAAIWMNLLKVERVSVDDDFFELGGNSIQAVILLAKIKRKFHKDFPLAFMFKARTICRLANELKESKESASLFSCLVPIQPNGTKPPLFCVHAGLGDVLFYQSLSEHLGQNQPFYGLQAQGLNGIEIPSTQMEQMASHYISEIRKVQPDGPYYLAGYCLGARIAFEMAQQLTREGQKVALLANFNGISYNRFSNANRTPQRAHTRALNHLRRISKLSLKGKIAYISSELKREVLRGYSFMFGFKLIGLIFKSYRFCKQKVPAAIARIYVNQSLHLLQSKYEPKAYRGSMLVFRSPDIFADPYLGWRGFIKGEINTIDVPGKHETRREIMNEPFVQFLAKNLKNFLDSPVAV